MTNTTTLHEVVAGGAPRKRPENFPAMLEAFKGEIARALPRHLNADVMARVALTAFRMSPKLAECQPASVFACVIQASQLGLRPGLLGEAYLIPYSGQCTLVIGYQGLLELVRRSGLVESISAHVVREADEFSVEWGTSPGIVHRPFLDGDAGAVRLVYAVARLKGGGSHAEVMSRHDVEKIRDRSQNVVNAKRAGKSTPWTTDFEEMARKTVLRRICKYLPKSPELASALALDDTAARGAQGLTVQDAIANTYVPPPYVAIDDEPTGEVDPPAPPPPPPPPPAAAAEPARRGPGRPRKAAPEPSAAPPEPVAAQQGVVVDPEFHDPEFHDPGVDGPNPRDLAEWLDAVAQAANLDAALAVLDEAAHSLGRNDMRELTVVFDRQWVAV